MVKKTKKQEANKRQYFQQKIINKSYLTRGKVALTHIIIDIKKKILKKKKPKNQPFKKKLVKTIHIKKIFRYSPKKKKAKGIDEYSIL